MDYGHEQAARNLIGLERRYNRIYSQAYREMKEKADAYFERFEQADREQLDALHNNEITLHDYTQWRSSHMQMNSQYSAMVDMLAREMTRTNEMAMTLLDRSMTNTFMENFNFGGYEICQKYNADIPFTLVDRHTVNRLMREGTVHLPRPKVDVPKDERWNRKKIHSALTQGILQGESIGKISKRLQGVTNMNKSAAIRNARTLTTGAENGGRLDKYYEAKAMGIPIMKKWESTLDNVTRESHVDVDGEVQEIEKPFSNGLDYPGAMGPPEEVYNCRCTMVSEIKGHKYSDDRRFKALGDKSYEQWKKERGSARNAGLTNNLVSPQRPRRADFTDDDAYEKAREQYRADREIYNNQKESLVSRFMDEPRKYTTPQDIIDWAESRNVRLENNVENLVDPKLIDPVLNTLDEMFTRFPEAKEMLDKASYFGLDMVTGETYFMEANGGLRLNAAYFTDGKDAYNFVVQSQAEGFLTRGSGNLESAVRHEYGHNMDTVLRQKFSTLESDYSWKTSGKLDRRHEARAEYERELTELTLKHGSEYSRTNISEAFAEGFSEYTSNPKSEYGSAFGKFFERWYHADSIE